ncbi:hypothetical protein MGG_05341 [Pyricularia oryzae 70-15]|uniref:DNA polymerase epsilon subunit C n=3 Tax=Pyricularia oryzae TaxID=318829 RepID=G4MKH7_PYRO7|nr:uncharacterized protein MGG_05341 [Pyricularia oryzae 70-15]EHA57566.1 hypothetical protein MGG_05341 [Pyricularia oryzae 70-15]ELQ37613.1 hypothetical protein OOU_Y34scaffold00589g10 [Pyricularia oryzae Y34]KAI7925399.1 hypothetical protein M0657_004181 [Pyricularia oryzae]KAI7925639.1 hypothetical protein M9X92_003200 [Pyricularia oryzae]
MDFWSRLLAHTPLSTSSPRRDQASDPIRRLHRFEKEYGQMLQIWRNTPNLSRDDEAAEAIELRLQQLTNILADETRRPLPHPCISFAASKQIYVPIAKIATTSYSEWIVREAVQFFATLIESEEEAFYESDAFATSLTNLLVRITGANSVPLASDTEIRVVELAFNITTKIRLDPDTVLPAWFKSQLPERSQRQQGAAEDSHEKFAGRTQKQDFPLFYLLVDYIHVEGKVGDFARTGLLYIIESASSSVALEQWIVESDLSTLMATGLGALYSQLSRKLVVDHPADCLPPVLALSDYQHPRSTYEIVSSCSSEFQAHLDTFLSHLLFWQDVLNHCRSVEVKSTLLEHFQVIFLQQLLYPSLLESSDLDGGSSVAVLTYLRRILESLDHPDMINLILHYLLALPDALGTGKVASEPGTVSAARKRKSMDLATMLAAQVEEAADPLLYNLVDLILTCLRSHSHQTIHVTLQLVSAILRRHHRYATATLLRTEPVFSTTPQRTVGAHKQEVDFFMSLAGGIGGQDNFDAVYEDVLRDAVIRLESHSCSLKLVAPKTSTNNHELPAIPSNSLPGAPQDVQKHTIRADDPLLNGILDLMETFFINPVETNLSATDVLFDLAVCGFTCAEGWLLRHPDAYKYDQNDDDELEILQDGDKPPLDPESAEFAEKERQRSMRQCRRRPKWSPNNLPRLMSTLQMLADQVEAYRESIPRFDELLQQRREAFQTADASGASVPQQPPVLNRSNSGAKTPMTPRPSHQQRASSAERPSALEGFAQRIMAELGSPSSRSASPRGRKESIMRGLTGSPTPDAQHERMQQQNGGMSGAYGASTPSRQVCMVPPREFPVAYDGVGTPRGGAHQTNSPALSATTDPAIASQIEAFRAVDQQILARRVALAVVPGKGRTGGVAPIPLDFGAKAGAPPPQGVVSGEEDDEDEERQLEHGQRNMAPSPDSDGASESRRQEEEEADAEEATRAAEEEEAAKTVSVSHVLTNVLVLQAFLFELSSLVQARAGLFDEVKFV